MKLTFQLLVCYYYLALNRQTDHDKPAQTAFDHPVTISLTSNQSNTDQQKLVGITFLKT